VGAVVLRQELQIELRAVVILSHAGSPPALVSSLVWPISQDRAGQGVTWAVGAK
jgi:hypothetical protein